ncbi:MAG: cytochrome c biogenesis protein CcsA [Desulfofustis sp.]|jgi:cytochrome c-type biogenesis protein CcsB|nr:cytochrome c biogenesis protein CcsA [Desulfofustis sp.]
MFQQPLFHQLNSFLFLCVLGITLAASLSYLTFFVSQRNRARDWARRLLFASWITQTLYIVSRYLLIGNTPVTTYHETVVFFAWATTAAYLSFRWRYTVKNFGTFVSLLIFALLVAASFASREVIPLEPPLRSWWLPVHAGFSLIAYGFLGLAFCGGLMYLLLERELKSRRLGYFFNRLPSLDALDQLNSHCLTIGFVFLCLGMISGSFWSKQAWGTYWRWNPKEVCSLIIWLVFLAQIHLRFTVGWRGRRAAYMMVAGFIVVILTLWRVTT